jgi:uncharacterized membrane protein YbhN (UPF0104 family)
MAPRILCGSMRRLRARLAVAVLSTVAVIAVAATPQLLGRDVRQAFERLDDARPAWIWLAALLVVLTLAAWAQAWRSVIRSCGGTVGRADAVGRYAIGSALNTVAPARLGDVLRIALFSRTLDHRERAWTSAGAYTTVGAARALAMAVLVITGYAAGALPLWPVLGAAGCVAAGALAAALARHRNPHTRLAHFFDAYRELGRRPREAAPLLAWILVSTAARIGAVAAIVSALGIHGSLAAALVIVPAVDAASLLPLTPGNIGIASGAVVVALRGHGIDAEAALTISLGLHAVEAAASVVCGTIGALALLGERRPAARRAAVALACAVGIAATVGGVFLSDLT